MTKWRLVKNFYDGLDASTKTLTDAIASGAFMSKILEDATNLLVEMIKDPCQRNQLLFMSLMLP